MQEILNLLLGPLALTVGLLLFVYASYKGWVVWGRTYDACVEEKNEWKQAALKGVNLAERLSNGQK